MVVELRPMTPEEYGRWRGPAVTDYAQAWVDSGILTLDEAQKNFNQSASPGADQPAQTVRYDDHGRPIQEEETPAAGNGAGETPPVASLAIPDYESLAASQVVPRLAGLTPAERAAVGRFETANRGRRTILNRIAQLEA